MEGDPAVQMAARVGRMFRVDPVSILSDGGDPLLNQVRLAAANVVAEDERKQAEEQQKRNKPRGGGGGRRGRKR